MPRTQTDTEFPVFRDPDVTAPWRPECTQLHCPEVKVGHGFEHLGLRRATILALEASRATGDNEAEGPESADTFP